MLVNINLLLTEREGRSSDRGHCDTDPAQRGKNIPQYVSNKLV